MKLQAAGIAGAGAVCAIGGGVAQIAASVRSGFSGMSASSVHDRHFEPIKMALVPDAALCPLSKAAEALDLSARQRRMLRLCTPALEQALADVSDASAIPVYMGLPESHPKRLAPASTVFLEQLQQQTEVVFDRARSRVFPAGRAAGLVALQAAMRCITEGQAPSVLVGGVDTFLDLALLAELDAEQRLLGERVMDGFVPGEAAAFVLLTSARRSSGPFVFGAGVAKDPGHRYGDQPARGDGLSEAIALTLSSMQQAAAPVRTVFASLNGESFGAKEWGVARVRHASLFAQDADIVHPADCTGDVGAGAGTLLLALSQHMLTAGSKPGPMLLWATSDGEDCACAYLDR
jgi:3-oxoacyl-[acyl-carrier-protein] synthase I